MVPREKCWKVSKNFLTLFDDFWRFLPCAEIVEKCRKTFWRFLTSFEVFWRGPFRRPLLQSADEYCPGAGAMFFFFRQRWPAGRRNPSILNLSWMLYYYLRHSSPRPSDKCRFGQLSAGCKPFASVIVLWVLVWMLHCIFCPLKGRFGRLQCRLPLELWFNGRLIYYHYRCWRVGAQYR